MGIFDFVSNVVTGAADLVGDVASVAIDSVSDVAGGAVDLANDLIIRGKVTLPGGTTVEGEIET